MEQLIRPEVLDLVESWCEWTGKRGGRMKVNKAIQEWLDGKHD